MTFTTNSNAPLYHITHTWRQMLKYPSTPVDQTFTIDLLDKMLDMSTMLRELVNNITAFDVVCDSYDDDDDDEIGEIDDASMMAILDAFDNIVTGDDHPDAVAIIMDAYHRGQENGWN